MLAPTVHAILVSGASSGIGEATVLTAARAGMRVYAGVRAPADAERVAALDANVRAVQLDVTDAVSIDAAVGVVRADGVALTGLVNNAGVALGGPIESLSLDALRAQFEVNCFGAIALTQAALPLLRLQPSRIVFVGSISGRLAVPYLAAYSASKFALRAFADALRIELKPSAIDVCLIEPGSVATPIWSKGRAMRDAMLARLSANGPAYYRDAIENLVRATQGEERSGLPPGVIADAIAHALTDRKPKAHRIIGLPARLGAAIALLPPSLHDRFLRATMRLP
ncbi:MAG: SDR family oxidoreductase [Candidatus Aquilonibacter sp.]|jgi:NAD(P)-dependent dehydrogenase (short-subunit alcohol dehydrogenase family)